MYSRNQIFKLFVCFLLALALKPTCILSSVIPDRSRLGDQSNLDNITDLNDLNDLRSNDDNLINSTDADSIDASTNSQTFAPVDSSTERSIESHSINQTSPVDSKFLSSPSPVISPSSASDNPIKRSPLISSNLTVAHTIQLGNDSRSSLNLQISATNDSLSVNQTYSVQLGKLNGSSDFLEEHKKLIQNLVKEESLAEDQNKLKNEISLNEKPSTNSILNEELLNEFKVSDESSLLKGDKKQLDDALNGVPASVQESHAAPKHFTFEMDDTFNLRISESMDCIFVRSEDGVYNFYSTKNHTDTCALYIIAESNQLVEFEFQEFNVSCGDWNSAYPKNNQSLVSIVDGWELNNQFFPGQDHRLKKNERYKELCLNQSHDLVDQKFRLSQNVGLIQFRILNPFEGFKVRVKFIDNPKPCNAILRMPQGVITLKNYGQPMNCSISILYPQSIRIISNSVGTKPLLIEGDAGLERKPSNYYDYQLNRNQSEELNEHKENNTIHTNTDSESLNKIESDYIELKGGDGLDPDLMLIAQKLYLVKDLKREKIDINCGNTAVRLVSSGLYENSVTMAFDLLDESESSSFKCPQKNEPKERSGTEEVS